MNPENGAELAPCDSLTLASIGVSWEKWMTSFKLYITAVGRRDNTWKCALLLHSGRPEIQDVFATLNDTREGNVYKTALMKSGEYFTPQNNQVIGKYR